MQTPQKDEVLPIKLLMWTMEQDKPTLQSWHLSELYTRRGGSGSRPAVLGQCCSLGVWSVLLLKPWGMICTVSMLKTVGLVLFMWNSVGGRGGEGSSSLCKNSITCFWVKGKSKANKVKCQPSIFFNQARSYPQILFSRTFTTDNY